MVPLGHYRLWAHGIYHGDISPNNLMYDIPAETGIPEGVLNDYDLASWEGHPTTNNDRTGTIPFMALDLLRGGLERQVPRLYRHDAESFVWVLAYLTAITIKYEGHSCKISRPPYFDPWFKDAHQPHRSSKRGLYVDYGRELKIQGRHAQYLTTVRNLIGYWVELDNDSMDGSMLFGSDDHEDDLEGLIEGVEKLFGANAEDSFTKVKTLLLEAIGTPKVV